MGKVLIGLAILAVMAGLYLLGVIIAAVATAIGSVVGMLVIVAIVVGWIYLSWTGYRHNRQAKKTGVGK